MPLTPDLLLDLCTALAIGLLIVAGCILYTATIPHPPWMNALGVLLPVPLACSVRFGAPLTLDTAEDKAAFLARARQALLDLQPEYDRPAATDAAAPAPTPKAPT